MEGSTKAVKKRQCGGGRPCRPLATLLLCALLIFPATSYRAFSQTVDVLIVQKPDQLVVYDSFQQSLASPQQNVLQSFVPMRILKYRDLLGDGITPCVKVDVEGEVFYLLRHENGHLAGRNDLGVVKLFRRVRPMNDTVEVLASHSIQMENPVQGSRRFLSVGDYCLRCFFDAGAYYVRTLGSHPEYGWLRLSPVEKGKSWQIARPEQARVDLPPMIRDRIAGRIKDANLAYTEVYSLLTAETGKLFPAPQWEIESTRSSLICTLRPAAAASLYPQAILALSATLRTYVLGTGFDVTMQGNTIEIKRP